MSIRRNGTYVGLAGVTGGNLGWVGACLSQYVFQRAYCHPKVFSTNRVMTLHSAHEAVTSKTLRAEQSVFWPGNIFAISFVMPSQKTDCSALRVILVTPWCALCSSRKTAG